LFCTVSNLSDKKSEVRNLPRLGESNSEEGNRYEAGLQQASQGLIDRKPAQI